MAVANLLNHEWMLKANCHELVCSFEGALRRSGLEQELKSKRSCTMSEPSWRLVRSSTQGVGVDGLRSFFRMLSEHRSLGDAVLT